MTLHPMPLNFLIYEENFISFFVWGRAAGSIDIHYIQGTQHTVLVHGTL
jgi:hypothetical protein